MAWHLRYLQHYLNSTSVNGTTVVNTFCLWMILWHMSMNTTLGLKPANTAVYGMGVLVTERVSMLVTKCWYIWEHTLVKDPTHAPMNLVAKAFHGLRTWKFTQGLTQARSPMFVLWQVVIRGTQIQVTGINIRGHIQRPNRITAKWQTAWKGTQIQVHWENITRLFMAKI